jgi:uncharacterized membrane protein YagU involved in acid resistance
MNDVGKGTLVGLIATAPMTLTMAALFRLLPARQQYRLPPRQITMQVVGAPMVRENLNEPTRSNLTLVAHFAYGAACGATYAPLARWLRPPGAAGGISHGVAVWTVSYLGWLPALGILPPATRHPAERNALMIAAHIVWGAAAGALLERLMREEEDVAVENRKHLEAPVAGCAVTQTPLAALGRQTSP